MAYRSFHSLGRLSSHSIKRLCRDCTDTSERGLERLICTALTGAPCDPGADNANARARAPGRPTARAGSAGVRGLRPRVLRGSRRSSRPSCARRSPTVAEALDLDQDGPTRRKFLARLQGEITQARHDRRAAPRHQARAASRRPLLRHALAGQRQGRRALRRRTASASPASSATAATRPSSRSTWASSSTACRSPPSS